MSNAPLLHTYEDQLQNLLVLVEAHTHRADEVAEATVANDKLLALSRQQMKLAQALAHDNKTAVSDLDQALSVLEGGGVVDEELPQKLKRATTSAMGTSLLLPDSLAASGVAHSSDTLLDELLSKSEMADIRKHLDRPQFERLKWTRDDYIAVAAGILVGLAIDILNTAWRVDSPIDKDGTLVQHEPS